MLSSRTPTLALLFFGNVKFCGFSVTIIAGNVVDVVVDVAYVLSVVIEVVVDVADGGS